MSKDGSDGEDGEDGKQKGRRLTSPTGRGTRRSTASEADSGVGGGGAARGRHLGGTGRGTGRGTASRAMSPVPGVVTGIPPMAASAEDAAAVVPVTSERASPSSASEDDVGVDGYPVTRAVPFSAMFPRVDVSGLGLRREDVEAVREEDVTAARPTTPLRGSKSPFRLKRGLGDHRIDGMGAEQQNREGATLGDKLLKFNDRLRTYKTPERERRHPVSRTSGAAAGEAAPKRRHSGDEAALRLQDEGLRAGILGAETDRRPPRKSVGGEQPVKKPGGKGSLLLGRDQQYAFQGSGRTLAELQQRHDFRRHTPGPRRRQSAAAPAPAPYVDTSTGRVGFGSGFGSSSDTMASPPPSGKAGKGAVFDSPSSAGSARSQGSKVSGGGGATGPRKPGFREREGVADAAEDYREKLINQVCEALGTGMRQFKVPPVEKGALRAIVTNVVDTPLLTEGDTKDEKEITRLIGASLHAVLIPANGHIKPEGLTAVRLEMQGAIGHQTHQSKEKKYITSGIIIREINLRSRAMKTGIIQGLENSKAALEAARVSRVEYFEGSQESYQAVLGALPASFSEQFKGVQTDTAKGIQDEARNLINPAVAAQHAVMGHLELHARAKLEAKRAKAAERDARVAQQATFRIYGAHIVNGTGDDPARQGLLAELYDQAASIGELQYMQRHFAAQAEPHNPEGGVVRELKAESDRLHHLAVEGLPAIIGRFRDEQLRATEAGEVVAAPGGDGRLRALLAAERDLGDPEETYRLAKQQLVEEEARSEVEKERLKARNQQLVGQMSAEDAERAALTHRQGELSEALSSSPLAALQGKVVDHTHAAGEAQAQLEVLRERYDQITESRNLLLGIEPAATNPADHLDPQDDVTRFIRDINGNPVLEKNKERLVALLEELHASQERYRELAQQRDEQLVARDEAKGLYEPIFDQANQAYGSYQTYLAGQGIDKALMASKVEDVAHSLEKGVGGESSLSSEELAKVTALQQQNIEEAHARYLRLSAEAGDYEATMRDADAALSATRAALKECQDLNLVIIGEVGAVLRGIQITIAAEVQALDKEALDVRKAMEEQYQLVVEHNTYVKITTASIGQQEATDGRNTQALRAVAVELASRGTGTAAYQELAGEYAENNSAIQGIEAQLEEIPAEKYRIKQQREEQLERKREIEEAKQAIIIQGATYELSTRSAGSLAPVDGGALEGAKEAQRHALQQQINSLRAAPLRESAAATAPKRYVKPQSATPSSSASRARMLSGAGGRVGTDSPVPVSRSVSGMRGGLVPRDLEGSLAASAAVPAVVPAPAPAPARSPSHSPEGATGGLGGVDAGEAGADASGSDVGRGRLPSGSGSPKPADTHVHGASAHGRAAARTPSPSRSGGDD